MKKLLFVLLLLAGSVQPATLASLIAELRQRTGEKDTVNSFYTNADAKTYLNEAQDKLVRLGGYIPKHVDILYNFDSVTYRLPASFKALNGAIRRTKGQWARLLYNDNFKKDTSANHYFIQFKAVDTALLYLGGSYWNDGDTARIFYQGTATPMTTDTSTCLVSRDLQVFIIEEAVSMYEQAKRSFQSMALVRGQVRQDMGFQSKSSLGINPTAPGGGGGGGGDNSAAGTSTTVGPAD